MPTRFKNVSITILPGPLRAITILAVIRKTTRSGLIAALVTNEIAAARASGELTMQDLYGEGSTNAKE